MDYGKKGQQSFVWDEVASKACHQSRPVIVNYSFIESLIEVEVDTQLSEEAKTKKSFVHQVAT